MCDPVTIAMTAAAASGGLQAYAGYQQGKAQDEAAKQKAEFQEAVADDARRRGLQKAGMQRANVRKMLGRQAVAGAASGVDISTGTSLDLFEETAMLGEFDAQVIENNAMREAWGMDTQAGFTRFQGQQAKYAGTVGAYTSILGAGQKVAGMSGGGASAGGARRAGPQSMAPQSSGFIPANTPGRR